MSSIDSGQSSHRYVADNLARDWRTQCHSQPMDGATMAIRPSRAGLVLATLIGGWHLLWALLVAVGWAQPLIDFIFWMHFIKPVYVVGAFDARIALVLVAVTAAVGYVIGGSFGLLWNRLHTQR